MPSGKMTRLDRAIGEAFHQQNKEFLRIAVPVYKQHIACRRSGHFDTMTLREDDDLDHAMLKKRRNELLLSYHPDKNRNLTNSQCTDMTGRIYDAYEALRILVDGIDNVMQKFHSPTGLVVSTEKEEEEEPLQSPTDNNPPTGMVVPEEAEEEEEQPYRLDKIVKFLWEHSYVSGGMRRVPGNQYSRVVKEHDINVLVTDNFVSLQRPRLPFSGLRIKDRMKKYINGVVD